MAEKGSHEKKNHLLSERTLIRLQAASGMVFGTFLSLHLATTLSANKSQEAYDGALGLFRKYYQNPVVEIVCIALALFLHVISTWTRFFRRPSGENVPLTLKLHRYSGYYLQVVIGGHILATRGVGLYYNMPYDFSFLHYALVTYPLKYVIYPYYISLALCGFYHFSYGATKALTVFGVIRSVNTQLFCLWLAIGAAALISAVLALGGNYYTVDTHRFPEIVKLLSQIW